MEHELLTQKIELILEMNGKKMLNEMQQLRTQVSELQSQLEQLKKAGVARQMPMQQSQASESQPVERHVPVSQQPEQPAQPPTQQRATQPIDRNNIAPADVSIEKIFYSGTR